MCLTLAGIEDMLLWLVAIAVVIGVLRILVPWVLTMVGLPLGPLPQVVRIIVIGLVVAAVIVFTFWLLGCFIGGVHLPRY